MYRAFLYSFCLAVLLIFSSGQTSWAQDRHIDDLLQLDIESLINIDVSAVSKKPEKILQAPGIVNVLTAKEIKISGSQTLLETLQRMPGVFGIYDAQFGPASVGIRGETPSFGNFHTLMLLNGRPIRESYSGTIDTLFLRSFPLSQIKQIELVRGPGSVLYGTNAFSGIVNIITKTIESGVQAETHLTYGSFNTRQGEGRFAYGDENLHIDASLRSTHSDGFKAHGQDVTGLAGSGKRAHDSTAFTMTAAYGGFTLNIFDGYEQASHFISPSTFPFVSTNRKQHFIDLGYEHALSETWKLGFNGAFTNFESSYSTLSHVNSDDWLGEISLNGALNDKTNVLLGATTRLIEGQEDVFAFDFLSKRHGIYAQIDYTPWDWLKLIAGAQLNKPQGVPRDVSPRFGAIVQFNDHWGGKFLYGEAFRSAYPAEQFLNIPGIVIGNPGLRPEKVETIDAQIFYQAPHFYGALTLFQSTQNDSIELSSGNYINAGSVDSHGGTLEGKANLSETWQLNGAITYQDNKESTTGYDAFGTPHWNAKAGVTWFGSRGVTANIFHNYYGDASSHNENVQTNPDPDSYHMLTANINVDLHALLPTIPDGIDFSVYGFNLLNEEIRTSNIGNVANVNAFETRGGRSAYATLSLKF